jgi:hypothetical protein
VNFPDANFWTLFLNISGALIWLALIVYMARSRSKHLHGRIERKNNNMKNSFDEEVFLQMMRQQAEQSLKRISDTIAKEQQLLWSFIERGTLGAAKNILNEKGEKDIVELTDYRHKSDSLPKAEDKDKYSEALKLANHGMPHDKIARIVDLPKSEVELLIKIRHKGNVANGNI